MKLSRIAAFLLAIIIAFSATGCKNDKKPDKNVKEETTVIKNDKNNNESSSLEDSSSEDEVTLPEREENVTSDDSVFDFDALLDSLLSENSGQSGYTTDEVTNGQYSIVTGTSARLTSLKISNENAKNCGKVKSERVNLCKYSDTWSFNHAACITYFNGSYYVTWMQGRANEDDLGQRIMYSSSKNFYNWTAPKAMSDTMYGELYPDVEAVQSPSGWFNNGETLMALYSVREYKKETLRENDHDNDPTTPPQYIRPLTYEWAKSSHFYKIIDMAGNMSAAKINKSVSGGNHSAFQLKSGRWIFPGSTGVRYSDDSSGLGAWFQAGLTQEQVDDAYNRGAVELCEADAYETDDGILHLLMRSETQYLWHTQSYDGGESWSAAYPTKFTNDKSKFDAGRLPDGRYYMVSNTVYGGNRNPLSICISEDGYNFDKEYIIRDEDYKLRKDGYGKGGVYGYPTCVIVGDYFYVAYSVGKEEIEVTRFKLSELK